MPSEDRILRDLTTAEAVELLGLAHISQHLDRISVRLHRIETAIVTEGATMAEIDDRLATLTTEVGAAATAIGSAATDVDRALADLKNALSGTLTAEQAAKFDAVDASLTSLKDSATAIQTAVDNADPSAPPVA